MSDRLGACPSLAPNAESVCHATQRDSGSGASPSILVEMSEFAEMDRLNRSFTIIALFGAVLLAGAVALLDVGIDSGTRVAVFGGYAGAAG